MDHIEAEYQRHKLDRSLKKHVIAASIPPCDDGNPCMDGRCPMCGSNLAWLLEEFLNSPQGATRNWVQAAFVLGTQTGELGDCRQFPLGTTRDAVQAISNALQTGNSSFIGTFGILVEKGKGGRKKVAAIEVCYSGESQDSVGTVIEILGNRFGAPPRPFRPTRRLAAGERSATLLAEELLYGYQYRDPKACHFSEGILKKNLLAELAQNYGNHRIDSRVVTHGLSVGHKTVVLSPGNFWPLPLNNIKHLKPRRWF
ncbi:hypothetical protein [Rhizobium ruizarguesonis]|uniref:hypothetical protein n=1 Tax=Rhizobium ruizarguesonis TaxID=2081791 RepID=UPI001030C9E5|nr:hypothetical protein [Rhizobium ruizarguesonis]TAY80976.1 hypothetical protein ELH86_19375 [Rhizobium ruizarguesonis]